MEKRKNVILGLILAVSVLALTGCEFGKSSSDNGDIVVAEVSPTPEETEEVKEAEVTPEPEETIAPDVNASTTYKSADGTVSIRMPDATWANKMDKNGTLSFESPKQGKILITHGEGEADLSTIVLPNSEDMAVTLEKAADMEEGTDFIVRNYKSSSVGTANIYSYTTRILNKEKSEYAYIIHKVLVNDSEYFAIEGYAKNKNALSGVKKAINSFAVLESSSLMAAAPEKNGGHSAGSGERVQGEKELEINEDEISDTARTRTIYSNDGSGTPRVIEATDDGWVDAYGNTYRFENEEDVYDQNDVDWYWGGEAADVYYMSTEEYYEE